MLAHVCHPKDRDYLIIIRLSERRFPSGRWKNKDYNRCAAEVLGKKTWRRPVHQKTFVPLGRVSSFCSSNIRNCDDYLTPKGRFSLTFALSISPSSPHSLTGGTASPHCAAPCRRTDGQCCRPRFQRCRSTKPLAGTPASSLNPRSLDAYTPVAKRFRALPVPPPN